MDKKKNNPSSIRFDREKMDLIFKRENISTIQKAITFLIDKYWWEFKNKDPDIILLPPVMDQRRLNEIRNSKIAENKNQEPEPNYKKSLDEMLEENRKKYLKQ